ncbi:MAG: response regulator, partial [Gammaproteobacteria bacterium]
ITRREDDPPQHEVWRAERQQHAGNSGQQNHGVPQGSFHLERPGVAIDPGGRPVPQEENGQQIAELDEAKVEAGKIEIHLGETRLSDFIDSTNRNFKHVTEEKHIDLLTEVASGLPELIITDEQRVSQIIRNLLSNAIKFTEAGYVKLLIERPKATEIANLPTNKQYLAFRVIDTGIGIPKEKQQLVFEAFQQADGTTSRKYGGTGLGLSISTQFAKLLVGSLSLESNEGKGSQFTLIIPDNTDLIDTNVNKPRTAPAVEKTINVQKSIELMTNKPLPALVIVSDDPQQLDLFKKLTANQYTLIQSTTPDDVMQQISKHKVAGMIIDLDLKSIDGLELINKLKENTATTNLPLMVFGSTDASPESITRSVIGYLKKPIDEQRLSNALFQIQENTNTAIHSLLIVEDDLNHLNAIKKLLARNNLTIETAATGTEALYKLLHSEFDCVILDLGLPDITGQEILKQYDKAGKKNYPAIIIYTGKDLSREDSEALSGYVDSIILKGSMASMDRLQEETSAFLHKLNHQPQQNPTEKASVSSNASAKLTDAKILLVDDDMRNVYALSRVLKSSGVTVLTAANGKAAIEMLDKNTDVKIVLMD